MLIKTSLNECFTSHIVHSFQQICSALSYAWFRLNNIIVDNYDTDGSKALLNPVILRTRSKPFIRIYSSALYLSIRLAQNISFERERWVILKWQTIYTVSWSEGGIQKETIVPRKKTLLVPEE